MVDQTMRDSKPKVEALMRWLYRWSTQLCNIKVLLRGLVNLPRYFVDWYRYSHLLAAEPLKIADAYPQLHDRTKNVPIDSHYFYLNSWAMRRILSAKPEFHVDIGSTLILNTLLSAIIPVVYLDYRHLSANIDSMWCVDADVLCLPFRDETIRSLSCLHVAEHIGLGRYGDKLDAHGSYKAMRELVRVLKKGGNLFFAVPIGRPRVCFNAHRIFSAEYIRQVFEALELVEFSGVYDNGHYVERVELNSFDSEEYACGLFYFRKRLI